MAKNIDVNELEGPILAEVNARKLSRVAEMSSKLVKDIYNMVKFLGAEDCVVVVPFDVYREHEKELEKVEEDFQCKVFKSFKEKKILVFY